MSTQTIQISAITIDNQRVIKTVDTKNIAIAAAILIASVITIAVSSAIKFESETVTMALLTAGGIFLVLSIYMMLNKSKKIIYKPTKSKVKHYAFHFAPTQRREAEKWTSEGFKTPAPIFDKKEDGNIRFDILISNDCKFAAVQLSTYENFCYNAYAPVVYLYNDEVKNISTLIE